MYAKAVYATGVTEDKGRTFGAGPDGVSALFAPRSIAFVGASDDPARIGGRALHYCRRDGYSGAMYPVNPSRETVQGLPAYPSIAAIPADAIDLLIIAIPPSAIAEVLDQAGAKQAKAAIVLTSGFSEMGPQGHAFEAQMMAAAQRHGIRLLGPNCLGLFVNGNGLGATFSSLLDDGPPPMGPLAIVSQSGAYGAHIAMLARRRGIGIARFVATGNETDVDLAELIAAMADDPTVGTIACFVEGIGDGRSLLASIERARVAGKPVLMMKIGRSATGKQAAQSHTASLAGDNATFDALMARSGAVMVESTTALIDALYLLDRVGPLAGDRLGILTVSGGAGILLADAGEAAGFDLAPMPAKARAALDVRIPLGSSANPVDTTAQAMNDPSLVRDAVETMLAQGGYDAIVGFFMNWPESERLGPPIRAAIAQALETHPEAVLAVCMNASEDTVASYEADGLLVFTDPAHAIAALGCARAAGRKLSAAPKEARELPALSDHVIEGSNEARALAILGQAGVPVTGFAVARDPVQAVEASGQFDGPLAIKVLSPDIQHKSDIGGVLLGIAAGEATGEAVAEIIERVRAARPDARLQGVLIAPMSKGIAELIVGARIDPAFGPVVSVGFGGIFAEISRDVSIGLAPLGRDDALEMLRSLKGFALLDGARGRDRADLDAAAAAVEALSSFIARHRNLVSEVEVNPLIVRREGMGAVAVDALIVPQASGTEAEDTIIGSETEGQ